MRILIVTGCFVLCSLKLLAQTTVIVVRDAESLKPVTMAHVCFESDDKKQALSQVTNEYGKVSFMIENPGTIAISCIGYKTLIARLKSAPLVEFTLNKSIIEVGEVVVTGQVNPQTTDKSIYKVNVISSQQIRDKAANSLADVFTGSISTSPVNNGILGKSIIMLGLSGENIKILVDGVPVIGRQDGNLDLEQVNLSNIDHIETIEGPMSVIYGSNALGGVVNLISRQNNQSLLRGNVNGYYESAGVYNIDGSLSTNLKNQNLSAEFGRKFFDGYKYSDSLRSFDFKPKQQYFGNAGYQTRLKKMRVAFNQELFSEQLRNPGNIYSTLALDEYHFTRRSNSRFFFGYQPDSSQNINLTAAYSYYNKSKVTKVKDMLTLNETTSANPDDNDTTFFDNTFYRGTYAIHKNKTEWLAGTDGSLERGDGKRLDHTREIDEYALFSSMKYQMFSTLFLQAGGRVIYNTKYKAPVVYSINILWHLADRTTFRASVGSGFRSPSLKELYLDFVDVNHDVHGNTSLKAENSMNYNLVFNTSLKKNKNQVEWQLQGYHNRIHDQISLAVDANSATKATYMNIDGLSKTIGLLSEITYRFHPGFSINGGVIYGGKSRLANLDRYTFSTDYTANIQYINLSWNFRVNLNYKYYGRQTQYVIDSQTESWVASYQMMNLSASRPFFNDRLNITIGIKNLLDYKQIDQFGSMGTTAHGSSGSGQQDISWGRTWFISLNYRFVKSGNHE